MKIIAEIEFDLALAPKRDCDNHGWPKGTIAIRDNDGMCLDTAPNMSDAEAKVEALLDDAGFEVANIREVS